MGEFADDAFNASLDAHFEWLTTIAEMEQRCDQAPCGARHAFMNDDWLVECPKCGKVTDI